jgi:hypothetical protein
MVFLKWFSFVVMSLINTSIILATAKEQDATKYLAGIIVIILLAIVDVYILFS